MTVYSNVLEMVGNTPLLEVSQFDTGPCRLFLKLELMNPGGSIKDRIGVSMVEEAARQEAVDIGRLQPEEGQPDRSARTKFTHRDQYRQQHEGH